MSTPSNNELPEVEDQKYRSKILKLFKDIYYFENERKYKIGHSFGVLVIVLSMICGIIGYYIKNLNYLERDLSSVVFCILFGITIIFLSFTFYFLFRAIYNFKYFYLPQISKINRDIRKINNYYKLPYYEDFSKDRIEKMKSSDIDDFVTTYYEQCLETNIKNNDRKYKYVYKSYTSLIVVVIFLVLSAIPFYIKYHSNLKIQKIEIINLKQEVK